MSTPMINRFIFLFAILLPSQVYCQNLIVDGEFSASSANFTSDLTHIPSCNSHPGTYCITDIGWHPKEASPFDYMMKVDGYVQSRTDNTIWSKTIYNIDSGSYQFSFWCFPRSSVHDIEIDVLINNNVVGSFSHNTGGWKEFVVDYTITNPMASLSISLEQTLFGHFTDWDLDNLSFFKKGSMIQDTVMSIADTISTISAQEPPAIINVFPNPLLEDLTLQVDSTFFPYTFALHDFAGRLIYMKENIREAEHHLNLGHLPRAAFIARIVSKEEIAWRGKLIRY